MIDTIAVLIMACVAAIVAATTIEAFVRPMPWRKR